MPKVQNFCGGVQVTVQRTKFMQMMNVGNNDTDKVTDVTDNVGKDVVSDVVSLSQVQLSERQREICKLIKANSFVSSKQMSVVLSVVHRTIQRDLADMQKKGITCRI